MQLEVGKKAARGAVSVCTVEHSDGGPLHEGGLKIQRPVGVDKVDPEDARRPMAETIEIVFIVKSCVREIIKLLIGSIRVAPKLGAWPA